MIQNERFNSWVTAPLPGWTVRSHRALPKLHIAARRPGGNTWLSVLLIIRPLAATVGFGVAAAHGWWLAAVPLTWLIYGSALTCVHHLIHGSLGLPPRARHFWLRLIGLLVAESGHALQVTHLAHHRTGDDVPDPEGYIEYATWKQLPAAALAFRYRLMIAGLKMAPTARRRRIMVEIAGHAALHVASLVLLPVTVIPWVYLSLIHLASFGFTVLAGKGPQTNYGRELDTPLVRVHTAVGRVLFFGHDQHLEHHAAPKVPLPHLHRFADQIDAALDDLDVLDVRMPL